MSFRCCSPVLVTATLLFFLTAVLPPVNVGVLEVAAQEATGESRQTEADRLFKKAQKLKEQNQFDEALMREAIAYYQAALKIYRELGNQAAEGRALDAIGEAYVYSHTGQYQQGLEFHQQALVLYREMSNREGEARSLSNIGIAYAFWGKDTDAIQFIQQSRDIYQQLGDRSEVAGKLILLGALYWRLDQYSLALELHQQALLIHRELGAQKEEAEDLLFIGDAYRSMGRYAEALHFYEQSLDIHQALGEEDWAGILNSYIGGIHRNLGQYDQALDFYQHALPGLLELDGPVGEAHYLSNLGWTYYAMEDHQKALDSFQQVLRINRSMSDHLGIASALNGLGSVYSAMGQYQKVVKIQQMQLEIVQELHSPKNEALALQGLASTYKGLGQYDKALELYQQSLAVYRGIGAPDHERAVLSSIGKLLAQQGKTPIAIVFYKQAVNVTEAIRQDIEQLPADLQQSYAEKVADTYRALAELLLQQDRILEAQEVLDLLKLQELDDYLRDIRRGSDTPVQQLDFWPAEQAILDLYNQQLQANSSFSFTDFVNSTAVAQQVEQLRRTAQGQNLNPDQLARLQDNLQQAGNAALLYPLILDDRIELVLVTTSGLVRQTVPIDRVELNRVITSFRNDITDPRSDPTANAQKLYQWIIAPIAQQLAQANVETILYAADGALRYIPLAALHDGEQWLTQQYTINHITAASLTDFRRDRTRDLNILAGAFPADRGYSVEVNGESKFYQGLPAAEIEVETIQAEFPRTNALFEQQFTPDAVVPQLENYSIIHFATHAQFVSGLPHESFILFGNGERVTLRDIGEWSLPQTDLVVLSACETAVSGELGNGEEILGFGYQMQRIGVEAAIASLWQVSDGGTQVLMNTLYGSLQDGYSTAEALQQAQMALIEGDCFGTEDCDRSEPRGIAVIGIEPSQPSSVSANLSHPYYWAPFILIGNGL